MYVVTPGPGVVLEELLVVGEVLLDDGALLELVGLDDVVALLLELEEEVGLDDVALDDVLLEVVLLGWLDDVVDVGAVEVDVVEVGEVEVEVDVGELLVDVLLLVVVELLLVVVELLLVGELLVVVGLVELDEDEVDVELELLGVVVGVLPHSGRSPVNG